jgi:hypothetical protein
MVLSERSATPRLMLRLHGGSGFRKITEDTPAPTLGFASMLSSLPPYRKGRLRILAEFERG